MPQSKVYILALLLMGPRALADKSTDRDEDSWDAKCEACNLTMYQLAAEMAHFNGAEKSVIIDKVQEFCGIHDHFPEDYDLPRHLTGEYRARKRRLDDDEHEADRFPQGHEARKFSKGKHKGRKRRLDDDDMHDMVRKGQKRRFDDDDDLHERMRRKRRLEEDDDLFDTMHMRRKRRLDGDDDGDMYDMMRKGRRRRYDDDDDDLYDTMHMRRQRRLYDHGEYGRPMDDKARAKKKTCREVIEINEGAIAVLVESIGDFVEGQKQLTKFFERTFDNYFCKELCDAAKSLEEAKAPPEEENTTWHTISQEETMKEPAKQTEL